MAIPETSKKSDGEILYADDFNELIDEINTKATKTEVEEVENDLTWVDLQ